MISCHLTANAAWDLNPAALRKKLSAWGCSKGSFRNGPIDAQSLPSVSDVDTFISHSRSSSSWLKMLAICHHLNLDFAIASSIVTWMVALLVMLLRAGSYAALLEESFTLLLLTIVVVPVTVLFLAYFGWDAIRATKLWFDKACVSNASPFSKLHTLQMIPAIVASSREMLVVWDECVFVLNPCRTVAGEWQRFSPSGGGDRSRRPVSTPHTAK